MSWNLDLKYSVSNLQYLPTGDSHSGAMPFHSSSPPSHTSVALPTSVAAGSSHVYVAVAPLLVTRTPSEFVTEFSGLTVKETSIPDGGGPQSAV